MDFYGNVPPATVGDLNTYVGGILIFSCGDAGCSSPASIVNLSNWTYDVAPVPGPVIFMLPADVDPHPAGTIDVDSGYPDGYSYFDYLTGTYLCGANGQPSAAICEQPAHSPAGGAQVLPWRVAGLKPLNELRNRVETVAHVKLTIAQ